jgi:hypothetical protein
MDWVPVSVDNFVLVHVSTPKGDLSNAHVLRACPSTQAPPSAHSGIWTAVLGTSFGDHVCYDGVSPLEKSDCSHGISAGCFRANEVTIDSTGLQEQSKSAWCLLEQDCTFNEEVLDE